MFVQSRRLRLLCDMGFELCICLTGILHVPKDYVHRDKDFSLEEKNVQTDVIGGETWNFLNLGQRLKHIVQECMLNHNNNLKYITVNCQSQQKLFNQGFIVLYMFWPNGPSSGNTHYEILGTYQHRVL